MCGIAGFIKPGMPEEDVRPQLRRMCDAIYHRGPDSAGYFVKRGVGLGMRRLSVIDVGGGDQPIFNEDGSVVVVFNGEIYNHHELRRDLEKRGHLFRTRSDTEVLVHAYEEYGEGMVRLLRGMFAFALWDESQKRLLVARDHSGMKPLSYCELPDGIVFFSELRSFLRFSETAPEIQESSVMRYLSLGYVPGDSSIFRHVRKLEPAHYLTWSRRHGIETKRYWEVPYPVTQELSEEELAGQLTDLIEKAVVSHLESDVPLGAFLSGGLDSSTVVAVMAKHAADRVKTFSIGFSEAEFDESTIARRVANELGTEHFEITLKPNIESTLDAIATMFDEPFGDSSAIPTFFVSQLARESVTVSLSGDAGDELFGGYSRYMKALGQHGSGGAIGAFISTSAMLLPHKFPGRNMLIDMGRTRKGRYFAQLAAPIRGDEGGVGKENVDGGLTRIEDLFQEGFSESAASDFAAEMMRLDFNNYLPGDILTKVDRASMAVSLEARVPFLDIELVEFAFRLPGKYRVDANQSKKLFRKAIKGLIPDHILHQPKKGFSVPLASWFRGPLQERMRLIDNKNNRINEFVENGAVNRLIREHNGNRRDHSLMLWRLLVLETWLRSLAAGDLAKPPMIPRLDYT